MYSETPSSMLKAKTPFGEIPEPNYNLIASLALALANNENIAKLFPEAAERNNESSLTPTTTILENFLKNLN